MPLPHLPARLGLALGLALLSAPALRAQPAPAAAPDPGPPADAARYTAPEPEGPEVFGLGTDDLRRWNVVLGMGAMLAPVYEGSDEFRVIPVPLVSATFGEQVVVDPRGLSFTVFSDEALSFRVRAGYDFGRDEDDSDLLTGLGDIDPGLVLGGTLAYQIGAVELRTSIGKILGGSDGTIGDIGAEVAHRMGPLQLAAGASAIWADNAYMDANFGITQTQSERSGLEVYDVSGGFRRVQVDASAGYALTQNWALRARLVAGLLVGDAADSPVVVDTFQPSAMLMLGYRF